MLLYLRVVIWRWNQIVHFNGSCCFFFLSSEFFQCDHCNIALQSDGSRGLELAIPINEEALPEKSRCSTNLEVGGVDASDICLTDWAWYFFPSYHFTLQLPKQKT